MVRDGAGIYYIYFKNAGAAACTLTGYPGVSAVTGPSDSASQIGSDAKRTATSLVRPQLGGLYEQMCAETALPTMSITAVGPDPE